MSAFEKSNLSPKPSSPRPAAPKSQLAPKSISVAEFRKLKKPNKYDAKATVVDGQRFASKAEANRYLELKSLREAGEIAWFITQVPFRLPGGIVYRADFLVVWKGGGFVTVEDVKGFLTPVSKIKIAQVEAIYGIKIEVITRRKL